MELLPGSVVFLVEGTHFRIPSALLQQHSEVLASMLDLGKSEDTPIELDDPLEAFCAFRSMLLTPLDSCLIPSHPMSKRLDKLLELLVLCHKYEAHKFEDHVASLVIPLVQTNTLQTNLFACPTISPNNVLQVATVVDRPEIGMAAHNLLTRNLWRSAHDPHEVLAFAESINDQKLVGTAYYQIMVRGKPEDLNPSQRQILDRGMIRCGAEWQRVFDSWGQGITLSGESWDSGDKWLHDVWFDLSKARIPWYDVVGKVKKVLSHISIFELSSMHHTRGRSRKPIMERELARIKMEVYRHFVD